jgi:hypothetical protein
VDAMTDTTMQASADATMGEPGAMEPTEAEIDAWAARERQRREAWVKGPTEDERAAYAASLRERRLAEAFDEGERRIGDVVRSGVRMGREGQLAAEGAVRLFYRWSRRTFDELVEAGREWEEETSLPVRRRRVPLDDERS